MQNARLDEAQAGIKIARRNINNLRYADDTTLIPDPGMEPRSPALQVDSLPSEPPGKPKNTGVRSLSLLQGSFLTQESNQGLLHCRQILSPQEPPGHRAKQGLARQLLRKG